MITLISLNWGYQLLKLSKKKTCLDHKVIAALHDKQQGPRRSREAKLLAIKMILQRVDGSEELQELVDDLLKHENG